MGKTTMCSWIGSQYSDYIYLDYDIDESRKVIVKKLWRKNIPLVVFDELHKMDVWKRWIKGEYDSKNKSQQFLVTGSARLDVYQKGGDSLLGRYIYWRLHPITIDELPSDIELEDGYERLLQLAGYLLLKKCI